MSRLKWNVVHDCDLEDGTPTEWSTKIGNKFYWIDEVTSCILWRKLYED